MHRTQQRLRLRMTMLRAGSALVSPIDGPRAPIVSSWACACSTPLAEGTRAWKPFVVASEFQRCVGSANSRRIVFFPAKRFRYRRHNEKQRPKIFGSASKRHKKSRTSRSCAIAATRSIIRRFGKLASKAQKAISLLNGKTVNGRALTVNESSPLDIVTKPKPPDWPVVRSCMSRGRSTVPNRFISFIFYFHEIVAGLGAKLGAILFQLPPNFQKDAPLLLDFLQTLPPGMRAAFEFRHAS
jgi:hypothetical protein